MDFSDILLEMQNRIIRLERERADLRGELEQLNRRLHAGEENEPKKNGEKTKRDVSRYLFNGNVYLKNRLVLAVVQKYVKAHETLTCNQLKHVFEKSLQGSIGVVEHVEVAVRRLDTAVRFFTKEEEVLHLADGDMYVCSQWGIINIPNFLARAKQLGFNIEKI